MSDHVVYERRGDVAWITLERPAAHNAMSRAMRRAVGECCERADACARTRVVIIRGAGGRAFSVGADITEFDAPASGAEELIASGRRWHDAVAGCRKPVVAAIDGYCLGGGLELALACDIRICTPSSVFALPEVGLGVVPGAGGTQRLPRVIGVGPALHLILTGARIDAAEAHRLGLVTEVVDGDVEVAAAALAAMLADNGQLAMARAKAAVLRGMEMPLDGALALEAELSASVLGSPEQVERAEAFSRRRR